jgi:hypothetical protein
MVWREALAQVLFSKGVALEVAEAGARESRRMIIWTGERLLDKTKCLERKLWVVSTQTRRKSSTWWAFSKAVSLPLYMMATYGICRLPTDY